MKSYRTKITAENTSTVQSSPFTLGGFGIQQRIRSAKDKLERHSQEGLGLAWAEAQAVALNRHEWCRCVAQCGHMDERKIKIKIDINAPWPLTKNTAMSCQLSVVLLSVINDNATFIPRCCDVEHVTNTSFQQ